MNLSKQRLVGALLERTRVITAGQGALSREAGEVATKYAIDRIMEGKVRDTQEAVNVWAACADGFCSMKKAQFEGGS